MTNINYLVFIWNVFVDTLLLLIVYAWKMYDMQTLHGGGIPMFRGTYLVVSNFMELLYESCFLELALTGYGVFIIVSLIHIYIHKFVWYMTIYKKSFFGKETYTQFKKIEFVDLKQLIFRVKFH